MWKASASSSRGKITRCYPQVDDADHHAVADNYNDDVADNCYDDAINYDEGVADNYDATGVSDDYNDEASMLASNI